MAIYNNKYISAFPELRVKYIYVYISKTLLYILLIKYRNYLSQPRIEAAKKKKMTY